MPLLCFYASFEISRGVYLARPGLEVIKHFMRNLAEHEILNVPKYNNIKKFSIIRLR